MSAKKTAEVLRDTKAVLARNGWLQGQLYDRSQADAGIDLPACRVCLVGALRTAASGKPQGGGELFDAAYDALCEVVGGFDNERSVAEWNDVEGRTVDEVFALLQAAIERAEAGAR